MATLPHEEVRVTLGVDTHEEMHVAVALDQVGRWLGELPIPTNTGGFVQLLGWASELGVIDRIGVEGTGSWGAGLSRWLRAEGLVRNMHMAFPMGVRRPRTPHGGHAA